MSTLGERVRAYALSRGIKLLIVDGPNVERYAVARRRDSTFLVIDSGTANGSHFGEVVYYACEAICASQRLAISVYRSRRPLLAS